MPASVYYGSTVLDAPVSAVIRVNASDERCLRVPVEWGEWNGTERPQSVDEGRMFNMDKM